MTAKQTSLIRILLLLVFLVMLPLPNLLLSIFGEDALGKVTHLSSDCENGSVKNPKPRVTVSFFIKNEPHNLIAGSWEGFDNFCEVKINDDARVKYIYFSKINYFLATTGNAFDLFIINFFSGMLLNIFGNIGLFFMKNSNGKP